MEKQNSDSAVRLGDDARAMLSYLIFDFNDGKTPLRGNGDNRYWIKDAKGNDTEIIIDVRSLPNGDLAAESNYGSQSVILLSPLLSSKRDGILAGVLCRMLASVWAHDSVFARPFVNLKAKLLARRMKLAWGFFDRQTKNETIPATIRAIRKAL